jgi:hypothetical protein
MIKQISKEKRREGEAKVVQDWGVIYSQVTDREQ